MRRGGGKRRKKRGERRGRWIIVLMLLLSLVLGLRIAQLKAQQEEYREKLSRAESEYSAEQERSTELEEESRLRKSLKYIEKLAREKLGLVFPDDILVRPEED